MHDALSTSDPSGSLEFTTAEPTVLARYRFALRTADFLLCRECGVYIGAVITTDAGMFGIVNTHALTEQPATMAGVAPATYDGENTDGRVSRREERWTPVAAVPW